MDKPPKPGPVKRWVDMSTEERARVAAVSKPPGPPPILPFRREQRPASGREGLVQTSARCRIRDTEKAVLYLFPAEAGGEVWVPKSVVATVDGDAVDLDAFTGDDWGSREAAVELEVRRWWVEKQGLPW